MSFIPLCWSSPHWFNIPADLQNAQAGGPGFVPTNLQDFVLSIIAEVFTRSAAVVPISALFALWSSGKGMQSLIAGLNVIYHVKETRNWLTNRLYSMLYMFLFVIAIIISLCCWSWKPYTLSCL